MIYKKTDKYKESLFITLGDNEYDDRIVSTMKTLVGLNAAVFITMVGVGMVMPLLPNKIVVLTGSDAAVGYIASSLAVSYILLQLPMGRLADRFGFKRFLIAGYVFCGLCGFFYYFAARASVIFMGRVIQGMGEAPLWALAPALLSLHYPGSRGRVMGFYNATLHVGLTLGPLLGIVALKFSSHISGDALFLFYSGACFVSALVVFLTVDDAQDTGDALGAGDGLGRVVGLLRDSRLFATLLGITLYGAGYGLFITTIPAYLLSKMGESQIFVQIFFACFYLAISFSQLLAGPMSDRWGRERFMISGLAVSALSLALFPVFSGAAALVLLTLTGLGLGFFYLSSMAYLNAAAPPSLKGSASGAYFLFWGVGYFAGPPLAGYLNSAFAPDGGFYSYCALMLAETLLLIRLLRRGRAKQIPVDV